MMSILSRSAKTLAVVLPLAACAQVQPAKTVDPSLKAQVTGTQVVLLIPQTELYVDVGGGPSIVSGPVGSLIDIAVQHHRMDRAEKILVPIHRDLQGFDFDSTFRSGMQVGLSTVDWLHADAPTLDKEASTQHRNQLIDGAAQPYVLLVDADYHLTHDFRTLLVNVTASLFPRHHTAKDNMDILLMASDARNEVFTQVVVYRADISDDTFDAIPIPPKAPLKRGADGRTIYPDPDLDDDEQRAITFWTRDGGKGLQAALADAAAVTSRVICETLTAPLKAPTGAETGDVDDYGKGLVLEKDAARVLVLLHKDHSVVSSDAFDVDLSPGPSPAPPASSH
jgi:hypothetical protein